MSYIMKTYSFNVKSFSNYFLEKNLFVPLAAIIKILGSNTGGTII